MNAEIALQNAQAEVSRLAAQKAEADRKAAALAAAQSASKVQLLSDLKDIVAYETLNGTLKPSLVRSYIALLPEAQQTYEGLGLIADLLLHPLTGLKNGAVYGLQGTIYQSLDDLVAAVEAYQTVALPDGWVTRAIGAMLGKDDKAAKRGAFISAARLPMPVASPNLLPADHVYLATAIYGAAGFYDQVVSGLDR